MGMIHRPGDLFDVSRGRPAVQRLAVDHLGQAPAFDEPHDVKVLSVRVPRFVHRNHVVVLEPGRKLGFEAESVNRGRVVQPAGPDHLEGHVAPRVSVASPVDDPHPPFADRTDEIVIADPFITEDRTHDDVIAGETVEVVARAGLLAAIDAAARARAASRSCSSPARCVAGTISSFR